MSKFKSLYIYLFIFLFLVNITLLVGMNSHSDEIPVQERNLLDTQSKQFNELENSLKINSERLVKNSSNLNDFSEYKEIIKFNYTYLANQSNIGFNNSFDQISERQTIYIQIGGNFTIKNHILVQAMNDQGIYLLNDSINYFNDFGTNFETYVELTFSRANNWQIFLNYTGNFSPQNDSIFVRIQFVFPELGFDFNSPIDIKNTTIIPYSVDFPFESVIFKAELEYNQRVDITISEGDNSLVLNKADVLYYTFSSIISTQRIIYQELEGTNGQFQYYWVRENQDNEHSSIWIEIKIKGKTGNIQLKIEYQEKGYSTNTAIPIPVNKSYEIFQKENPFKYLQATYFRFSIPEADVKVNVFASGTDILTLSNSRFIIYFEREIPSSFVKEISETSSFPQGTANGTFTSDKAGTFLIKYLPGENANGGKFDLVVSYTKLPQFIWKLEFILFDLFLLLVLPIGLIYFFVKNSPQNITEWELKVNQAEVFKSLSKNSKLDPKIEVPNQKFLLIRRNYLIKELIIEFIPIDKDSTTIAFKYKSLISNLLLIIMVAILISFWVFNVILYWLSGESLLPYRVPNLSMINQLIFFIFLIIVFISVIVYLIKEITIHQTIIDLENAIDQLTTVTSLTTNNRKLDNEFIQKNLAYVRVLWNQADKAFKENNFSLFIIRADNAVKKLLEIRFQQLVGKIENKIEFSTLIETIRQNGFDIPSNKKIEIYRKIRNKIVHSSHMLEEKTAIETYAFYSKFLTRLGLRT